ncbi:MAG: porphobilinogen synthase [Ethanoligenens sp.]|uniref:porphobilinogen synthase n=1 Tax=Ethanoligenens sp. TaxID=2099655 RepID=UPI0039EC19BE
MELSERPRRLRRTPVLRSLARETRLSPRALIWPLFIVEGQGIRREIPSLPGQYHYSPDKLPAAVEEALAAGVSAFLLFGLPALKDELGSGAYDPNGVVQQGLRLLRERFPHILLITDVCMCEYTSHGHCGILHGHEVDNDATLPYIAKIALSHAQAGADIVAPSDMMDGRVAAIRRTLDNNSYSHIPILSYAVKYASAFYGPFRDAAGSAPAFGDRKGYQMDPHNVREALREAALDVREGADMLMVKPAMSYLDVVHAVRERFDLPLAAYSVSGEYAMIKAGAQAGLIDEYAILCESALSVFRAGADIYITYYAKELAQAIQKGDIG